MKIEIELPDWVDERNIYVLAGIELAAYKNFNSEKWHVKSVRCDRCGKCCMQLKGTQYPKKENGDCLHLASDGALFTCSLGPMRPLPCNEGDPVKSEWEKAKEFCCIRYDGEK